MHEHPSHAERTWRARLASTAFLDRRSPGGDCDFCERSPGFAVGGLGRASIGRAPRVQSHNSLTFSHARECDFARASSYPINLLTGGLVNETPPAWEEQPNRGTAEPACNGVQCAPATTATAGMPAFRICKLQMSLAAEASSPSLSAALQITAKFFFECPTSTLRCGVGWRANRLVTQQFNSSPQGVRRPQAMRRALHDSAAVLRLRLTRCLPCCGCPRAGQPVVAPNRRVSLAERCLGHSI